MTFQEFIPFVGWAGGITAVCVILSVVAYLWLLWVFDGELDEDNLLKQMWEIDCFGRMFPIAMGSGLAVMVLMCVGFAAVIFYPITLTILTFMLISYIARMGIRHRKLFDKHTEDKDAHKEAEV